MPTRTAEASAASSCGSVRDVEETQEHQAQPVITAPAPARGWRQASAPRRVCALAAVPVITVWTLGLAVPAPLWSPFGGALGAAATVIYAVLGPTVCYAAARVLRPHRGPAGERLLRHPLAAAGTAYGLPLILAQPLADITGWSSDFAATTSSAGSEGGGFIVWMLLGFGLGAAALGVLTAAWGVVALLMRAAALIAAAAAPRRRLPAEEPS